MAAQIKLRGMEVSDRFPALGFTLQSDRPMQAEVALATDPSLFKPESRARRSASNFYSSREDGLTHIRASISHFDVPARVLLRFVGAQRLYFVLAEGSSGTSGLHLDVMPQTGSPFVSLRNFTGRTLQVDQADGHAIRPPAFDRVGGDTNPAGARINPPITQRSR